MIENYWLLKLTCARGRLGVYSLKAATPQNILILENWSYIHSQRSAGSVIPKLSVQQNPSGLLIKQNPESC